MMFFYRFIGLFIALLGAGYLFLFCFWSLNVNNVPYLLVNHMWVWFATLFNSHLKSLLLYFWLEDKERKASECFLYTFVYSLHLNKTVIKLRP